MENPSIRADLTEDAESQFRAICEKLIFRRLDFFRKKNFKISQSEQKAGWLPVFAHPEFAKSDFRLESNPSKWIRPL